MVFPFFKSKDREKQKMDPLLAAGLKGERSSNPQVSIKLAEHFLRENKRGLAVDEYLNAAQAFLEKRQMQLAMAVYRNIITIDPERYSVYETLADLYRNSGFPGDGASVLLALAYQYKKAGCDSEVKRTLDSVLDFAPDNPVLKRKVQAFFAAESHPGGPHRSRTYPHRSGLPPLHSSTRLSAGRILPCRSRQPLRRWTFSHRSRLPLLHSSTSLSAGRILPCRSRQLLRRRTFLHRSRLQFLHSSTSLSAGRILPHRSRQLLRRRIFSHRRRLRPLQSSKSLMRPPGLFLICRQHLQRMHPWGLTMIRHQRTCQAVIRKVLLFRF